MSHIGGRKFLVSGSVPAVNGRAAFSHRIAISNPQLTLIARSCPCPNVYSYAGSMNQPSLCLVPGQYMKSNANSPANEFFFMPNRIV